MQSIAVEAPKQFKFLRPTKTPRMQRKEEILRPLASNYSTSGDNVIRFILPKKHIDLRESYLEVSVEVKVVGGSYKRLSQGAHCIFRKIRWFVGDVEETIDYYNRIQSLVYNTMVDPQTVASIGQDLLGYGTKADREAKAGVITTYSIPLNIGLFTASSLPLGVLERDCDFNVELTLENPLWCVETDGTDPEIKITNARWHYHALSSDDGSYERDTANDIRSGQLRIGYGSWVTYQSPVDNNIVEARINWNGSSLSSIMSYFMDQSKISDPTVDDKFSTWVKTFSNGTTIKDFQLQLRDGVWTPAEAIDCSGSAGRAFHQYLDVRGLWTIDGEQSHPSPIDLDSFNLDQFLMVMNLNIVPQTYGDRKFFFNQLSTKTSANNTLLRINLTGSPPPQHVVYHFIYFGTLFDVTSQGKLVKHL